MASGTSVRVAKRLKIFEPGVVQFGRTSIRVHLLDLSCTGALLHGTASLPQQGTIMRIHCKGVDIAARVAWIKGHKFGVAFLKPLLNEEMRMLIDAVPALNNAELHQPKKILGRRPQLEASLIIRTVVGQPQ